MATFTFPSIEASYGLSKRSNPKIRQAKLQNKIYPEGRSTQGKPGTRPRKKR